MDLCENAGHESEKSWVHQNLCVSHHTFQNLISVTTWGESDEETGPGARVNDNCKRCQAMTNIVRVWSALSQCQVSPWVSLSCNISSGWGSCHSYQHSQSASLFWSSHHQVSAHHVQFGKLLFRLWFVFDERWRSYLLAIKYLFKELLAEPISNTL